MSSLEEVLARSKQVMNKTKDMKRGLFNNKIDMATGELSVQSRSNQAPVFSESVAKNSNLPKEIIDVIRKGQESNKVSVLDSLDINKQQVLGENRVVESNIQQVQQTQSNGTIDYSLIRMMIEDTMKKCIGQLKKTIINENQNSGLQLMTKKGNTFRFVTEDGKVFEGKLTYKGNLNS